jgi:hypothetical protein
VRSWSTASSEAIGSSHDDEARLQRQRARDAHALALAARQLGRPPRRELHRQLHRAQELGHPLSLPARVSARVRSRVKPWMRSGSADDLAHRQRSSSAAAAS